MKLRNASEQSLHRNEPDSREPTLSLPKGRLSPHEHLSHSRYQEQFARGFPRL